MTDWTDKAPDVPGWYWYSKCVWPGREQGPFAVLVEFDNRVLVGWVPFMDYAEPVDGKSDSWPGKWFGPIDPPPLNA